LPFTTELGKNWELWQAYRELECNTIDEHGTTFISLAQDLELRDNSKKDHTFIVVDSDLYVNIHMDRNQYFLPGGLTARGGSTERVQAFAHKSNHIYYRGIRILDLKAPSENTYNILAPIELTEDRTAKSEWSINYEIEGFLTQTQDKEVVKRAITAPPKSHEGRYTYDYSSRSETFLDSVEEAGEDATSGAKNVLRTDRPPEPPPTTFANWIFDLLDAIERDDYNRVAEVSKDNKAELLGILRTAAKIKQKEDSNNAQFGQPEENTAIAGSLISKVTHSNPLDDDIPF
jgi:hypothetical protein